jgi:hypothetical protein
MTFESPRVRRGGLEANVGGRLGDDRLSLASKKACFSAGSRRPGMELRIAQSHLRYTVHGGRRNDAAESARDPIPLIVGHDQQDIWCAFGRHDLASIRITPQRRHGALPDL